MNKVLTQAVSAGQLKQITRVGTDALEKAIAEFGLDKDGAQQVHIHGDSFVKHIRAGVDNALRICSESDKSKEERLEKTREKARLVEKENSRSTGPWGG